MNRNTNMRNNFQRTLLPQFLAGSIRNRLIFILIAFTVIPALLLSLTTGPLIARSVNNNVRDTLNTNSILKDTQISTWIEDLRRELPPQLENRNQDITFLLTLDPDSTTYRALKTQIRADLQLTVESSKYLDELFILDNTGTVFLSTDPIQENKSYGNSLLFQRGLSELYLQPVSYELSRKGHSIFLSMPIETVTGETAGVFATRADMARIDEIMLERSGLGETGETYLVTPNFALFTQSHNPRYQPEITFIRSEAARRAIKQNQNGTATYRNYEGETVIGSYRWIPQLQLALITEQQAFEALASVRNTTNLLIASTIISIILAGIAAFYFSQNLSQPLFNLTQTAEQIAAGNLDLQVDSERQDEIGALARTFNRMTLQLRELITNLEQLVNERTQALQQRTDQLMAATDVGRSVATILETEQLIQQVVELIQQRFDLYYVGLFLVDENREWAVLKAGTGRAGQAMLTRNHRLRIGQIAGEQSSMIGWSVANAQARIALEAGEDPVRLATPDLPETRSEAAIPLRSRGQVLGALTVQDRRPNAFDPETIAVFQVMADQVAVALDNTNLFAETQQALEASQQIYGQLSRRAWLERLKERSMGYRRSSSGLAHLAGEKTKPEEMKTSETNGNASLVVPIKARGQTIGYMRAEKTRAAASDQKWRPEEVGLLESLIDQLGVALESARLFESTQQQAERERLIGEITTHMRATPDIDSVLQTAARELRQALDLEEVEVRLGEFDSDQLKSDDA